MAASSEVCTDCGTPLVRHWWAPWGRVEYKCANHELAAPSSSCHAVLCKTCHGRYPLMVAEDGQPKDLSHATMKQFCKPCFQAASTIDFTQSFVQMKGSSGVVFVYVHGGGGSRQMFYAHAQELNQRHGHGAVLLDLPGHGKLVDTPLTLESSAEELGRVLKECGLTAESKDKIIYVGGSLGAYIGFSLIEKYRDVFSGAILMDCGQNVGPGASLKARLGLVLLKWVASKYSNADLMNMMAGVSKKSKADYQLIETCFGAGNFFEQGEGQVECLKAVAPADFIPKVTFPILYMNGSEDYRDSEKKWLGLSVHEASELKVYDGGDHFFTHDSRFLEDILQRMHDFASKTA